MNSLFKASSSTTMKIRAVEKAVSMLPSQCRRVQVRAHKVDIKHEGEVHTLEVEEGETILDVALEQGLDIPHDCKMGVCMTCPARIKSGTVDAPNSMLSEDVIDLGFTLLCVAEPTEDCVVETVDEDVILEEQLMASKQAAALQE